jgi:DNA-binding CsgD family transcriptional regulator
LIEALELASPTRELQRIAPVALARAEAAWLRGHRKQTVIELRAAFELARKRSDPWTRSALEFWLWRAGGLTEPTQEQITPFALQIAGKWKEAADAWERLGCPYERAMALADGDEPAQLTALGIYEQLGATPASEALRLKLRTSGVRRVRRGPHSSTKDNPAGLTARQMDVLGLLAEGLSNSQIAEKLFISPKTVDHHISAILAKLDARTRSEAVTLAFQRCVLASK